MPFDEDYALDEFRSVFAEYFYKPGSLNVVGQLLLKYINSAEFWDAARAELMAGAEDVNLFERVPAPRNVIEGWLEVEVDNEIDEMRGLL